MTTRKLIQNLLLAFWFGWFALAGIIVTGLFVWLTPLTLSVYKLLLIGSSIGIIAGGLSATFLLVVLWRRYGKIFFQGYLTVRMIRDALFRANANVRQ
jgi:hypothetical protein